MRSQAPEAEGGSSNDFGDISPLAGHEHSGTENYQDTLSDPGPF